MKNDKVKKEILSVFATCLGVGLMFSFMTHSAVADIINDIDGVRIQDTEPDGLGNSVQHSQLWAGPLNNDGWGVFFVYDITSYDSGDLGNVTSADFSAFQDGVIGPADLQVTVFTRGDSAVQSADYEGLGTGYTSSIETLQTSFGGANSTTHTLSSTGQNNLTSFLNTEIDDDYLFIRIVANTLPTASLPSAAFRFGDTGSDQTAAITSLSFGVVPEPSVLGLIAIGGAVLFTARRRSPKTAA